MAGATQQTKPNQARAASGARRGLTTTTKMIIGVSALPLVGVLLPSLIVLVPFMLPTISALLFDRSPERYLPITVGMLNFCGTLPALGTLWGGGQSFSHASYVLGDPMSWMIAYATAALGWFLYSSLPPVMAAYYHQASKARIQHLRRRQKELIETWGEDVGQSAGAAHPKGHAAPSGTGSAR